MALRYSTAVRNFMASGGSFKQAFQNGRIEIYTGNQPATADAAVTGTLLCTITAASAAITAEVLSSGTLTLTGGAAGSVNTFTVNGVEIMGAAVAFNTSLTQTAADVAAQINRNQPNLGVYYFATSAGAVITVTAARGSGTAPNTFVVAATFTTITGTPANMAGGVAAANGLKWDYGISTIIVKLASQAWTGVNAASGTAGYYRQYGSVADTGVLDSNLVFLREDGAIATSGAELNMASTALVVSATTTISAWSRTFPTQ